MSEQSVVLERKPRPSRNDAAVRSFAVRALAEECAEWGDVGLEEWVRSLSRCRLSDNGYEIAKELDDRHHVSGIDLELVEILDCASSHLWDAHTSAVKAWAAENDVRPLLEVGTRVSCWHGLGTISDIRADEALYLFVPDNEREKFAGGGGICIAYEELEEVAALSRARGEGE